MPPNSTDTPPFNPSTPFFGGGGCQHPSGLGGSPSPPAGLSPTLRASIFDTGTAPCPPPAKWGRGPFKNLPPLPSKLGPAHTLRSPAPCLPLPSPHRGVEPAAAPPPLIYFGFFGLKKWEVGENNFGQKGGRHGRNGSCGRGRGRARPTPSRPHPPSLLRPPATFREICAEAITPPTHPLGHAPFL